jgi:ACT domain-containing protein
MDKMRLKLLVELPDTPGQLVNILHQLSALGANVSTIIHEHDNTTADGKIPVHFTLDGSREVLKKGLDMIREESNIDIVEIDGVLQKEKQTFLLLGDITTGDIMDTIHSIDEIKDVKIVSVDLNIGDDLQESVCKLVVETRNHRKLETLRFIQEISDKNNLILIKEI